MILVLLYQTSDLGASHMLVPNRIEALMEAGGQCLARRWDPYQL